jgi:hypothetical protein
MKAVYLDDRLHWRVKLLAARKGQPLKQVVESLLDRALRDESPDAEVRTSDMQALAARGGSFDFLDDERENLYSLTARPSSASSPSTARRAARAISSTRRARPVSTSPSRFRLPRSAP